MAQTPEGRVKAAGAKIIAQYAAYRFAPVTGGMGTSGLFDEVVVINGYFVGIEYKATEKKKPTTLQQINAKKCMDAGGIALLIHNDNLQLLDEVLNILSRAKPNKFAVLSVFPAMFPVECA